MHHWTPETREPEKGFIEFQVKATESLHFVENNKSVTCRVKMADLHFWHHVIDQPVVLVLYDAEKHRAFWIDIQEYVEQGREFEEDQDEAIIRIPVDNKLTVQAVDKFRRMSLDRIARLRNPRP